MLPCRYTRKKYLPLWKRCSVFGVEALYDLSAFALIVVFALSCSVTKSFSANYDEDGLVRDQWVAKARKISPNNILVFENRADAGDTESQMILAYALSDVSNVPKDPDKALRYLLMAAQQNNPFAQAAIIDFIDAYSIKSVSNPDAFQMASASAKQENIFGIINSGSAYMRGNGVEQNLNRAYELFIKAFELRHPDAPLRLCALKAVSNDRGESLLLKKLAEHSLHYNYDCGAVKSRAVQEIAAVEIASLAAGNAQLERQAKGEQERLARAKAEQEKTAEADRIAAQKAEQDLLESVMAEERKALEVAEQERLTKAQAAEQEKATAEAQRMAAEKSELDRQASAKVEEERKALEVAEQERIAKVEAAEQEKAAAEAQRMAAEKSELDRLASVKAEEERRALEVAEQERIAKIKAAEQEKAAAEAQRMAAEKTEQDRLTAAKAEEGRKALEVAEQDRLAKVKAAEQEKAAAEAQRMAAEKAEVDRLASVKAEEERKALELAEQERLAKVEAAEQEKAAAEAKRAGAEKTELERLAKIRMEVEHSAKTLQEIPRPGQILPEFTISAGSGQPIPIEQYRGNVLILYFFASWCQTCRNSVPHLLELHSKYGKQGLQIIGMSVDQDAEQTVKKYSSENYITYPLVQADESLQLNLGVRSVPVILVVDTDGRVAEVFRVFNDQSLGRIENLVKKLLVEMYKPKRKSIY